jgi:methionyl-tRNA formyltransferase
MKFKNTRVVFMGTPYFAKEILAYLLENEIKINLVVTQPDKPAGRKKVLKSSEVKIFAEEKDLPLKQFERLDEKALSEITEINPDIIIVAAYGMIIPPNFLEIPKFGFINIHTSLLPKLRGASPIQTAIAQGFQETGVTIMKIDKNLDSGDILAQKEVSIKNSYTHLDLEKELIKASKEILIETLDNYLSAKLVSRTPKK